jgi:predicted lipoprotein with Yx(FWY)xxD motif
MGFRTMGKRSSGSRVSRWRVAAAAALTTGSLILTAALSSSAWAAAPATTVTVSHNKTWGTILVLSNGDTVYRLTADPNNKSVCSGSCTSIWPPVDLAAGQKAPVGHGVTGLGTISRGGGVRQVTYKGVPLYRFAGDHKAGQVTGNLKDSFGQWYVVNPANPRGVPKAAKPAKGGSSPATTAGSGAAY